MERRVVMDRAVNVYINKRAEGWKRLGGTREQCME